MNLLENFIASYKKEYVRVVPKFDKSLMGLLKKSKHILLDDRLSPSIELIHKLEKLEIRVKEPMKVAITGQFSSGKSTFLNALLAKNILPTGITPVTSKVNYIRYGDELKIRVKYKDGRDEYHNIESINNFTDQRRSVEDIDFLTLYSPLNMLKDIVFVDTPGLNSSSNTDTTTTIKVLQEVDGIIWLTLIDNAGKMSEAKVLQKYLGQYKNKSLCVLNQKDKFSEEEIEKSMSYVKEAFGKYFSKVVPISAKQALESRSSDKIVQMNEALDEFTKALHVELEKNIQDDNSELIKYKYNEYKSKIEEIADSDLSRNIELSKKSNITKVIDFIKQEIQPKAIESKEYAIKKELNSICATIISQYELFLKIFDELKDEIESFEIFFIKEFESAEKEFSKDLKNAYNNIRQIIDLIATEIYNQINTAEKTRFEKDKKKLFTKNEKYISIKYEIPFINSDEAYKKLFYEENLIGKMFKKYSKNLADIEERVNRRNAKIYKKFEEDILLWQSPNSILRKKESIHSDIEFANMRKFAARVYEHVLKPYNDEVLKSFALVSSEFKHISSAIEFNYQNATKVCISFLTDKMQEYIKLYEQNPTRFSLYYPTFEDIKHRLEESFFMYKLENMISKNRTFLNRDYERMSQSFRDIKKDKLEFIDKREKRYKNIITLLKKCQKDIV